MEQEITFNHLSPRKVRKQLLFSTPSKEFKIHDARSDSIQATPKCKMSKSKVIEKVSKNKFVVDFDLEKNYNLDQIDTNEYFKTEQKEMMLHQQTMDYSYLCSTNASNWLHATPYKTERKPQFTSANMSMFTSVIKETRKSRVEDSPFCKLLNESDQYSAEKYQTIAQKNEIEDNNEDFYDKYANQVDAIENFFDLFKQRSCDLINIFTQDSIFEIIGESDIHPLITTINAIAKVFTQFDVETGKLCFEYKFACSDDDREIIITTTGKLMSENYKPDFVLSAKVLVHECLIQHIKLKLC